MKNAHIRHSLSASIMLLTSLAAPAALSQSTLSLEEVVVTAQKREQSLQDVGIAINAFDGEAMESMGVVNSNDIASKIPNLNIMSPSGEGGVVSVFIRGIGLNDFALNNTGPVGFYVDGSSIGSSNGQLTTLYDVDRIEVLKGPQGTLFGRNTTGGAINIISKRPTEEFEGNLKLSAGNYGYLKSEGVLSGALSDNVNARLAVVGYGSDGYQENLSTGNKVEKQNYAGRLLLDYLPSDDLSLLLNIHASRNDSDSDLYGKTSDSDFYKNELGDKEYRINVDTRGASLNTSYSLNDEITLTSITSYDDLDKKQQEESDITPLELVELEFSVDTHTFSQELRLNGTSENLNWIAGFYYLSETINWTTTSFSGDFPLVPSIPELGALGMGVGKGHQELTTKAVFGQWEYELSDNLTVIVGARYTDLDVDFDLTYNIPNFANVGLPSALDFDDKLGNQEASGKLGFNYYVSDDAMVYGSITRGFKGGGFNGGVVSDFANYAASAEYEPEILTAYELGVKSTVLDGTLRLNGAVFYYDYEDAQVFNSIADPNTGLPQNRIENAKSLELYGLDLDIVWQASDALFIQAGIGYTHSEFDQFDLTVPLVDGTSSVNLSGETPQNTPEWSGHILGNYTWSLDKGGRVYAQLDASYQDDVLYSNGTVSVAGDPSSYTRNQEVGQEAFTLFNARVAWADSSDQWEVGLWGKNLADKEYAAYMFELTNLVGADQVMRGVPRTYGIDIRFSF